METRNRNRPMDPREQEYLRKIEILIDSEKARFAIDKAVLETA